MNAGAWHGHQRRGPQVALVYGPEDLATGPRQAQHAQRHPKLRHLPLPKAGLLIRAIGKDGRTHYREAARSRANDRAVIHLVPPEFTA